MGARPSKTYTDSFIDEELEDNSEENTELRTIPDYLRHHALTMPDTEAVVFASPDGSRVAVTWKQWHTNATTAAKSLLNIGIKPRELVAICLCPCPEWLYITFGAMIAGARPIAFAFTYRDGSDVIALTDKLETVSLVVLDSGIDGNNLEIFKSMLDSYDENGRASSEMIPYMRNAVTHNCEDSGGFMTFDQLMTHTTDDIPLPNLDPEDIAGLFLTSGSSGNPKVVTHTHSSLIYMASMNAASRAKRWKQDGHTKPPIYFNDRPFTWMGGYPLNVLTGDTRVTRLGTTGQLTNEERVRFVFDVARRERCVVISCLPSLLQSLMDAQDSAGDDWPVKVIATSGQPITKRLTGCIGSLCDVLYCIYGGTELITSAGFPVMNPDNFVDNCCGYPVKGVSIKVVGEDGHVVPVDTPGEICIRSKGLFRGYYNDTREVLTSDGWFYTDDFGSITKDGVLFVDGRKSDMIVSGGQNVMPSVLEKVLTSCPGVNDAVCVPIPHEVKHQVVCACVNMADGYEGREEILRAYCQDTHNDKGRTFTVVPEYFLFMGDFSKTWTGKLSRKDIAKKAQAILAKKT